MAVNRLAYLLAGAVIGAAGTALVKEGKGENLLQNLVQGGHGLTEKLLCTVETVKEDVEDYLAEAKYMHEEKAAAAAANEMKEKPEKKAAPKKKTASKTKAAPKKKATEKKAATKKPAAKKGATTKKTTAKKSTAKSATKKKTASS